MLFFYFYKGVSVISLGTLWVPKVCVPNVLTYLTLFGPTKQIQPVESKTKKEKKRDKGRRKKKTMKMMIPHTTHKT